MGTPLSMVYAARGDGQEFNTSTHAPVSGSGMKLDAHVIGEDNVLSCRGATCRESSMNSSAWRRMLNMVAAGYAPPHFQPGAGVSAFLFSDVGHAAVAIDCSPQPQPAQSTQQAPPSSHEADRGCHEDEASSDISSLSGPKHNQCGSTSIPLQAAIPPPDICEVDPDGLCKSFAALLHPWGSAPFQSWEQIPDPALATKVACEVTGEGCLISFAHQCFVASAGCILPIRCLHLYTDGSWIDDLSSWGVVALAETTKGEYIRLGHFAGVVQMLPGSPDQYLGAQISSNYVAELSGIAWALLFLLQLPVAPDTTIHFDSVSAADAVQNRTNGSAEPLLVCLVQTFLAIAASRAPVAFRHVAAHSGHPWNEYADRAAAAVLTKHTPEIDVAFRASDMLNSTPHKIEWALALYLGYFDNPAYPPRIGSAMILTASAPPARVPQSLETKQRAKAARTIDIETNTEAIKLMQFNAQSMSDGRINRMDNFLETDTSARRIYLDTEFAKASVDIAGIQEARSASGVIATANYLVLKGGHDEPSQLGCEIWIRKSFRIADRCCNVAYGNLVCIHAAPRLLIATLSTPICKYILVVMHAPISSSPPADIQKFWDDAQGRIEEVAASGQPIVIFADINGRLGSSTSCSVGPYAANDEDMSGVRFHTILKTTSLALPSTFPGKHQGQSATWLSPQETLHRIDYIAVPVPWLYGATSFVDTDMDVIIKRRDHFPLVVTVAPSASSKSDIIRHRPPIMSRQATRVHDQRVCFTNMLSVITPADWVTHVDDHWESSRESFRDAAQQAYPQDRQKPRAAWLTDTTWALIRHRSALRASAKRTLKDLHHTMLRVIFGAWAGTGPIQVTPAVASALRASIVHDSFSRAYAMAMLHAGDSNLKTRIQREREQRTYDIAEQAALAHAQHDSRALYSYVRELAPRPAPKPKMIKDASGIPMTTPEAVAERWRDFFARKLAGIVCTLEGLQLAATTRAVASTRLNGQPADISDFISPFSLLRNLASLQDGRGHGPDSLPAEIYKSAPQECARILHALLFKCTARIQEPLRWKGACLSHLYKGSGDASTCANFRSICVGDCAAKVYHHWLRYKARLALEEKLPDGFFGGFPGRGTDMCALQAREIWSLARSMHKSAGTLYVDVVGAFDVVLRELLFGCPPGAEITDLRIAATLKQLGFTPNELHEVVSIIPEINYLSSVGVPERIAEAIGESHMDTWFLVQGSAQHTLARTGSKPGDPLGDLLYNYLMFKVRAEVDDELVKNAILQPVPVLSDDLFPPELPQQHCFMKGATYVDDDSYPVFADTAMDLLARMRALIGTVSRAFRKHGLPLNFKETRLRR